MAIVLVRPCWIHAMYVPVDSQVIQPMLTLIVMVTVSVQLHQMNVVFAQGAILAIWQIQTLSIARTMI